MALRPILFGIVTVFLFVAGSKDSVAATPLEKQACVVVTSLPAVISAPGHYCLAADFTTSSFSPVKIQTSNVLFDCKGHSITSSIRDNGSDGISGLSDLSGITIQNCTVRNFDRGINAGLRNTNLSVLYNHIDNALSIGIQAWGNGTRVVGNHVTNTHNIPGQSASGINLLPFEPSTSAIEQVLMSNVVAGTSGDTQVVGIQVSGAQSPKIIGNHILGLDIAGSGPAISLWLSSWAQGATTTNAQVINNTMMSRSGNVQGLSGQPASCVGNISVGEGTAVFGGCLVNVDNTAIP